MRIRFYLNFFFVILIFFSSLSFSQNKPVLRKNDSIISSKSQQSKEPDVLPFQNRPKLRIYDSLKVRDGYIISFDRKKNGLIMNRLGKVLFDCPGSLISFFNNNNELLVSASNNLVAYNKSMYKLWEVNYPIHHELLVTPDNRIMFLSNTYESVNNIKVRYDNIICLDSNGKELYTWSTLEQRRYLIRFMMNDTNIFRYKSANVHDPDSAFFNIATGLNIISLNPDIRELFHMNSIQIIPENETEKKDTTFRKGNILLCFNNFNDSLSSFIAVADPVNYKILWHYVQKDRKPMHTPTMLPNGNILMYINAVSAEDSSFIDEINPLTKKVIWTYTENFQTPDLCIRNGSCQRLPNGNTLISNKNGNIYEVTQDKKIVWHLFIETRTFYRAYFYPEEKLNWFLNEK